MKALNKNSFYLFGVMFLLFFSCSMKQTMVKWKYRKDYKVPTQTYASKFAQKDPIDKQNALIKESTNITTEAKKPLKVNEVVKDKSVPKKIKEAKKEIGHLEIQSPSILLAEATKKINEFKKQPTESKDSAGLVFNILSLVFGCLGFVTSFIPVLGALFSIGGIIFGIIGLKRGGKGKGMAIAGLIAGGVGLIINVLVTLYYVYYFMAY